MSLTPGAAGRRPLSAQLFGWLLLALALRALAAVRIDPVTFDSAVYFEIAARFGAARWADALAAPYPPLYPAAIAGLHLVGLPVGLAGALLALVADCLVLFPLAALAALAAGPVAAGGAALLWAVHPVAIRLGVEALTDAPTVLLVALALWAGLRALETDRLRVALGAGALSGFAYLCRPEGLESALGLAVVGLTASGRPARRLAWVLAPLAGWALVAAPYVAYISMEQGSLTLSKKKSASGLMRSLGAPLTDESAFPATTDRAAPAPGHGQGREPAGTRGAAGPLATRDLATATQPTVRVPGQATGAGAPPSRLRRAARNVYIFQKPLVNGVNPLVIGLGFLGFWRLRARAPRGSSRVRALLLGLLGLHLAVLLGLAARHGAFYVDGRHFFLMVLYILPFAGGGLAWMLTWSTDRLRAPRWVPVVAVVLLVGTTGFWALTRRLPRGGAVRPAATWIRARVAGTPVVVTNVAKLTYHAGADRVELTGSYDDILRRARARSAQFMAFYPDLLPEVSGDFLARLNTADVEFAGAFAEPSPSAPDQRLEVYRLKPR